MRSNSRLHGFSPAQGGAALHLGGDAFGAAPRPLHHGRSTHIAAGWLDLFASSRGCLPRRPTRGRG
jgi:hypothetical protein